MRNYNLGFISDEVIYNHIKDTVLKYQRKIDLEKFNSNFIDPIKLTFDAKVYGKSFEEIVETECVEKPCVRDPRSPSAVDPRKQV